jgi:uncharacterized protein
MPESTYPEEPEFTDEANPFSQPEDELWSEPVSFEPVAVPRPGIGGSLLWVAGVLVVHLIGGIIAFMAVADDNFMKAATDGDQEAMLRSIEEITKNHGVALVGGEMAVFVIAAVFASLISLGRDKGRKLGSNLIRWNHLLLLLAAVVPLSIVSGALYQWSSALFKLLAEANGADQVQDIDTMTVIRDLGKDASVWVLLPLIAIAPAISEELVFRGVIGRGLIARYGLVTGVLITTFLFSAVHLSPAHVIAVFPLGLFMHYLYITTRSFWAPVLFHFLNNGMSTIMLKLTSDVDLNQLQSQESVPIYGVIIACVPTALIVMALWRSRVQYENQFGDEWSPGYVTLETPPNDGSAIEVTQPTPTGLLTSSLILGALMIGGYVVSVQAILEDLK